jgi:hypothetical protein
MTAPSDPHSIQPSTPHGHADHHHASGAPSLFSDAEWTQLLLYSAIAIIVAA